ncbi:hypothetical protein [Brucella sp. 2280]|uniref:hypothetical protein n=1 Tax=Brucella sp. 2280 TaxID=2592625 RepID=UPI0012965925|nr:hypothetical protein [Brucella sp. 2280]QGA56873.1 hypothetical protein GHC20_07210 [Brucella sp. 2280]
MSKRIFIGKHSSPQTVQAGKYVHTVTKRLTDAFAECAGERLQRMEQDISDITIHLVL